MFLSKGLLAASFVALVAFGVALIRSASEAKAEPKEGNLLAAETSLREAERMFAKSMADRNFSAFVAFLDEDAIFSDDQHVDRGRSAVGAAWEPYFSGQEAPFSWEPEFISVMKQGNLGFSSGPVYSRNGDRIGTFNSVWRRNGLDGWRVVFDRGCPSCACP